MPIWNLEDVHKLNEMDALIAELQKKTDQIVAKREQLSADMSTEDFMTLLQDNEELMALRGRLFVRASLDLSTDTADAEKNARKDKVASLYAENSNQLMFFTLWFKSLSDDEAKKFIEASGKYAYYLDRVRSSKPHTLEEKEEQILNIKGITSTQATNKFYNIITAGFRHDHDGRQQTSSEMGKLRQSTKREDRVAFYDKVYGKYGENQNILGEIYKNLVLDWNNVGVKLRKHESAISIRNKQNDVPDESVTALINVVQKNVGVLQEYFALKKDILKMESIDRYDLYAPLPTSEKKYSYEECEKITLETYREFDEVAYEKTKAIMDAGHVHSELMENKRGGAYCNSYGKDAIPYIFLNFDGTLDNLFTMVHEFGHGIHGMMASEQTQYTFHSSLPLAETASIFGEKLLAKKMLKEASREEKIMLLMKNMDDYYSSLVRQAYFVKFEIDAHKKIMEGCTTDELNEMYLENLREQFGEGMPVADVFKYEWNYIPHIHQAPFYCYAYSFGNLLVLALYKMYEKQGKDFIPSYMKILSYGGSKAAYDILQEIGVDITQESFWQQGFDVVKEELELLKSLVSQEASA